MERKDYLELLRVKMKGNNYWKKTISSQFKKGHKSFVKKNIIYGECPYCKIIFEKNRKRDIYCSSEHYWKDLPIRFKLNGHPTKGKPNLKMRGEKHPNWNGGSSGFKKRIYESYRYKEWREKIFKRDNYICLQCLRKGGKLEAHHIKAFIKIIEENNITTLEQALNCKELWNIHNGKTLCEKCHKLTDNYGNKRKN